jgi:plastocyanin
LAIILVTLAGTGIFAPSPWAESGSESIGGNGILALLGNDTIPVSVNASVTIVSGSSSPNNSKFFVPNLLNVSAGTTVTWTNEDLTSYKSFEVEQLHTVTSGGLESGNIGTEFNSNFLGAGKSFQHTFNTTGTFDYFCIIHPFMTGRVIVS